jgi:alcohol dehydrogenase class IV
MFEFATAGRILFGCGVLAQTAPAAAALGRRALLVTGRRAGPAQQLAQALQAVGVETVPFAAEGEPTVQAARTVAERARAASCDLVIGFGGGSVIDLAKAAAALQTNPGDPFDFLEGIGRGRPLTVRPTPCIAIPTTAGTGAEVTRNAVLASPEHRIKVSLRHPLMLPTLAVVDPECTLSMPPEVTTSSGLDALTQLLEPFFSCKANPLTDGFCREGLPHAVRSLRRAVEQGEDLEARTGMALASLLGGLALANAGLGAVHGFAGPLGGRLNAPHGNLCAALLPQVMRANWAALRARAPRSPTLDRFAEFARLVGGFSAEEGLEWLAQLCRDLHVPPLSALGVTSADLPEAVAAAQRASSMKGNPILLTERELEQILEEAL